MKVLVCDPISQTGIDFLKQQEGLEVSVLNRCHSEKELLPLVGDVSAMAVRSETKVTKALLEAAANMKIVGRAGVGVDNIDIEAATQNGVIVMNTPGGNTIATCELTFSMMMALARNIPQAHGSMASGEWNRKAFKGVELYGKTLGVLGMGRIGGEVARRAVAFGMRVLAFDPYITPSRAKALQVELSSLDEIYKAADFITVHMPLTDETRGMLSKETFAKMKPSVRLLNCARGGIVSEADLIEALQAGQIGGAALDVYESEPLAPDSPLRQCPNLILTPHLGASTAEAQDNVGLEVAQGIADYLLHGSLTNSINMPSLDAQTSAKVQPYLRLGERMGLLLSRLGQAGTERLVITYGGLATELPGDPIARAIIKGFLGAAMGEEVNLVNVRAMAKERGLIVEEIKSSEQVDFKEWLHIRAWAGEQKVSVGGSFFGLAQHPRIVRLNSQPVEIVPEGILFMMSNNDRPGIVGHLGSVLGNRGVNIANMSLGRDREGGEALTALNIDSVPSAECLAELEADPDISNIRIVQF
ncbi:MAG: phosphoglycerate dehydrogenase [Verrucomicrobiota bacterium]|jgi:D-3-phosphoglycerate dehydrogenase|nr:phosphoglycerate dehydrogenase [Verrucomicrobiota bacterium]|tara:strand:+ start:730 stop:2319 length:1590 start_codon:yes stop_codon:yes gene_type:complete